MAKEYFSIRIFSAPAVLISLASIGVLFGLQKMKTTLFLTIFLNLSNLSLDVLLVLVFDLGSEGRRYRHSNKRMGECPAGPLPCRLSH